MTDEVLRRAHRESQEAPDDIEALRRYARELERRLNGTREIPKIQLTDSAVICLLCEKSIDILEFAPDAKTAADLANANFDRGTEFEAKAFTSYGSYGSQVLDMSGSLHFVLCDGCIIRHSSKMIFRAYVAVTDEKGELVPNDLAPDQEGEVFKHEWQPPINARDHYESWWKNLWRGKSEEEKQMSSYYRDVSPYFKD